jgi:hypothetical protein
MTGALLISIRALWEYAPGVQICSAPSTRFLELAERRVQSLLEVLGAELSLGDLAG